MNRLYIVVSGGLGNQLFQYAFGCAQAQRLGMELWMDDTSYAGDLLRSYLLHRFHIEAPVAPKAALKAFYPSVLATVMQKLGLPWAPEPKGQVIRASSFAYHEPRVDASRPALLWGYWQSERYFAHLRPQLLKDLTLRQGPQGPNRELLSQIQSADSACVHVRRGDYVSDARVNAYQGTCSLGYYREALARLRAEPGHKRFYIFSDDIPWCREQLPLDGLDYRFVDHNRQQPWEDLRLMAACRSFVIANSTFSWWGAWLSERPYKKVIGPRAWFATSRHDTRDLLPASWTAL